MSWVDELSVALQQSKGVDAGVRDLLMQFLQANRSVLEGVGAVAGEAFFRTLAAGDGAAAWDCLAAGLNEEQVLALLKSTRAEMAEAAAGRAAQRRATQQVANDLANVALSILVRALVSAL